VKRQTILLTAVLVSGVVHGALGAAAYYAEPPPKPRKEEKKPKPKPELASFRTFTAELPKEEEIRPPEPPPPVPEPPPPPDPPAKEEELPPEVKVEPPKAEPPKPKPAKPKPPQKEVPVGEVPDTKKLDAVVTPAPLTLSNLALKGGIKVQSGAQDVFGNPNVDAEAVAGFRQSGDPDGVIGGVIGGVQTSGTGAGTIGGAPPKFVQAKPRVSPKGKWPESAPVLNRRVVVVLQLTVDETGAVTKAKVVRGAGEPFDSAAERDIYNARFEPATRGGSPVATTITWKYFFDPP
jgi:protein TonB